MEKRVIIYTLIIIVCTICLGIGVYAQFFYKYAEDDAFLTGKIDEEILSEEMYQNLENNFDSIFTNKLNGMYKIEISKKEDQSKDIVYAKQIFNKIEQGKYEINISIPYLNLTSEAAKTINEEIKEIFGTKFQSITTNNNTYTIYNINYAAFINQNILSFVIKATLKEGQNSQRVIIKTYNYNLDTDKSVSLEQLMNMKDLKREKVQKKIAKEIEKVYKENLAFEQAGYTVYKRDKDDSMYKVENTENYFLSEKGYLYILYPYGNSNYTSEVDIIIFT